MKQQIEFLKQGERISLPVAGVKSPSMVDEVHKSVAMVYLQGCNFNCGFCHNAKLIQMPDEYTNQVTLDQFNDYLKGNFLIDGVVFTGGEPTLHEHLVPFFKLVGEYFEVVAMDTNGSHPKSISRFSPFLTRIAMDIKATPEKYHLVTGTKVNTGNILKSMEILCHRSQDTGRVEFRLTHLPNLITIEDILAIGDFLIDKGFQANFGSRFVIQQYIPSDGVRDAYRNEYKTTPIEDLLIIGKNLQETGVPTAIRSQEQGYTDLHEDGDYHELG